MEDRILSINIDMGMKYNGIYYAVLAKENEEEKYEIIDKSAVCISTGSINYSKIGRRSKRHVTAGYQREKLAKRLFDEIIGIKKYESKQQELLHGLFKNRGFTYLTVSDKFDRVSDEYIEYIETNEDIRYLKNLYSLEDIETELQNHSPDSDTLSKYIGNVLDEVGKLLSSYIEYSQQKKESKGKPEEKNSLKEPFAKPIYKLLKDIRDIFLSQQKEMELGQKHRKTYFEDIKKIIDNKIDFVDGYTKDELYHMVCNISNLQLRCLRKYFNGKFDNNFNNELLGEKLYKFYISRHYRINDQYESESKDKLKPFMEKLKNDKDGLIFLKTADPFYTIPPMEDMNNRGGYKCNVLLIKDEFFNDDVKKCLDMVYGKKIFIDHDGQIIENISYFKDNKGEIDYEKAFRRFVDYSLSMIDKTENTPIKAGFISESSHPRKVFTANEISDEYFKSFYFRGYEKEYIKFKELLIKYYSEERNILNGIYTENKSIFKPCGCNAPLKNNVKEILIKSLFRDIKCEFSRKDAEEFEKYINNTKYNSRSKIYNFLSKVSEQAKRDKNSFFANAEYCYKQEKDDSNKKGKKSKQTNKAMDFSFDELELVIKKIAEILTEKERDNFSILNSETLRNRLNICKQLFDILDKDIKGYYKTCRVHTIENEQRSQVYSNMGHAIYKRLLSRVAKPINGMLDMHLDRLSYDIVKNIPFDISQFNKLEINVEENRFNFEEDLKIITNGSGKGKKTQQKYVCPYTGKEFKDGDYDHIIPRSSNLGIFNSEANLIYCSQEGNQKIKGNKEYGLKDINSKHKKQVFGTDNYDEIIKYIETYLNTINTETYTNFGNLNNHQQNAFRYALFLYSENNELFNKAFDLLKQDKLKTITNGTQKRLISLIFEKALLKNNNLECSSSVVESMLVRAVRNDLSVNNENIMKADIQNNHSHCIDASIVFYLSHSNAGSKSMQSRFSNQMEKIRSDYNYFNDIYLEDSSVDVIEKKRKFITLDKTKHDMGSIKYFDDTVYSIYIKPFKISDNKKILNNINILIEHNLVYKHINKGKKFFITNIDEVGKNDYLWVDKQKYFDLLFLLFHSGNMAELEKLKFMDDDKIESKVKKEVKNILFIEKKVKDEEQDKEITKYVLKDRDLIEKLNSKAISAIYNRMSAISVDLPKDEWEKEYEEICNKYFNPHNSKRLRKTRRIYSLEVSGQANYIIKRTNNTYQALRSKNIATPTYLVDNDVISLEFYSKNAIPFKVDTLLKILKYKNVEKIHIYEKEIKDMSIFCKDAAEYIKYLKYTFSESGRVRVLAVLNKSAFGDIDFGKIIENRTYNIKDDDISLLVKNYIDNQESVIYRFICKPRADGKQIKILKQTADTISLVFPKQMDKEFKLLVREIYETYPD